MGALDRLLRWLREVLETGDRVARARATEIVEVEIEELENIFALLVLGSFVGLPSPPMHLALELMPEMERELIAMLERVDTAVTPFSHLFSTFDIG